MSLPPGFSSSGEVALDRRYRWAKASLEAGEPLEARDILRQTVADAPHWPPAWKLLGDALVGCGEAAAARLAFEQVLRLDHSDGLGASLDLARLGALPSRQAMPAGYVAALFDDYADRFDAHLTGALAYRGPQAILAALGSCGATGAALRFARALDLGCGTGLMGEAIRPFVGSLAGVDLSPAMLAKARAKLVYDRLALGELVAFLLAEPGGSAALAMAADVLVYVADLAPVLAAAAQVLAPGGLFAFTVQFLPDEDAPEGFRLGEDNRFAHSPRHIGAAAAAHRFAIRHLEPVVTRQDAGRDVPGLVAVLAAIA